jgi:hypothetical protein
MVSDTGEFADISSAQGLVTIAHRKLGFRVDVHDDAIRTCRDRGSGQRND